MAISVPVKVEKPASDPKDYNGLSNTLKVDENSPIIEEVQSAFIHHYGLSKLTESAKLTIMLTLGNIINNDRIGQMTGVMLSRTGSPYKDFTTFKFNQDVMKRLISFLEVIGYLEVITGYSLPSAKVPTRVQIKDSTKLQACLIEQKIQSRFCSQHQSVILKNKGDQQMGMKDFTPEEQDRFKWAPILALEHFEIMSEIVILSSEGLVIKPTPLKWVYNNNFEGHGRNYFNLQNIPSEERKLITFDGQATTELDFISNGPTIMYAKQGLQLEEDAYKLEGFGNRKMIKMCFTLMCNTSKNNQAWFAVYNLFKFKEGVLDIDLSEFDSAVEYNDYISKQTEIRKSNKLIKEEITAIIAALETKHNVLINVGDYGFYSKNASKLMFIDGQVSTRIIQQFVEMGEPLIPIHDGFIVRKKLKRILRYVMLMEYSNVLGKQFKIDIKED